MADYFGKDVFKLGFGLMRLPKNPDGTIDIPRVAGLRMALMSSPLWMR